MTYNQQITLLSLNVNSLSSGTLGRRKRQEICHLVQHTNPHPDIVFIQDHRLDEEEYYRIAPSFPISMGTISATTPRSSPNQLG
jgi:hypothetical protein